MKKFIKVLSLCLFGVVLFVVVSAGTYFALDTFFGTTDDAPDFPAVTAFATEVVQPPPDDADDDFEDTDDLSDVHISTDSIITEVNNDALPWNLILVNRYNALDADFQPQLTSIGGGHYFDARAAHMLTQMLESAREEGLSPVVVSSHRSVARQRTLFDNQVQRQINSGLTYDAAFDAARRVVAYPGTSEHNLGLAVDITSVDHPGLTASFGRTAEGIWLAQNSHRYGFVLRYPYDAQDITNIIYEPWHFRYVGVEHAARMFEQGVVLEQYVEWYLQEAR